MSTNTTLRKEGMRILAANLGLVETERFISLIISEPFDYTKWQQNLYDDMTIEELCEKADNFWKETHINEA